MKGLRKKTELPKTLKRCVCPQESERRQKKTSNNWYKKQEKKLRTRSSEYPNTKIWRKKLQQKMLAVSRI